MCGSGNLLTQVSPINDKDFAVGDNRAMALLSSYVMVLSVVLDVQAHVKFINWMIVFGSLCLLYSQLKNTKFSAAGTFNELSEYNK
jgi:hypothetical protein